MVGWCTFLSTFFWKCLQHTVSSHAVSWQVIIGYHRGSIWGRGSFLTTSFVVSVRIFKTRSFISWFCFLRKRPRLVENRKQEPQMFKKTLPQGPFQKDTLQTYIFSTKFSRYGTNKSTWPSPKKKKINIELVIRRLMSHWFSPLMTSTVWGLINEALGGSMAGALALQAMKSGGGQRKNGVFSIRHAHYR